MHVANLFPSLGQLNIDENQELHPIPSGTHADFGLVSAGSASVLILWRKPSRGPPLECPGASQMVCSMVRAGCGGKAFPEDRVWRPC